MLNHAVLQSYSLSMKKTIAGPIPISSIIVQVSAPVNLEAQTLNHHASSYINLNLV
jgi:hypothetical protein